MLGAAKGHDTFRHATRKPVPLPIHRSLRDANQVSSIIAIPKTLMSTYPANCESAGIVVHSLQ
jgi:hypothetical protein